MTVQEKKPVNPLLEQTETGIEAKIPPEMRDAYDRIVIAGMKIMFDPKTHQMMLDQLKSGEITKSLPEGIAGLMVLMYKESKEKMPLPAAIPAAMVLMTKALDFAEKTQGVEITPDLLAQITQETAEAVLTKFGITPQMVADAVKQSQGGKGAPAEEPQQSAPPAPQPGLMGAQP